MKVLFLGLKIFSHTGGIEQVNRNWLYALRKIKQRKNFQLLALSMYDSIGNTQYIDSNEFICTNGNKWLFGLKAIWHATFSDIVIIPHLNLSLFALIAKLVNPRLKIVVQLHGIEAWYNLSGVQEKLIKQADKIVSVSNFTNDNLLSRYPELKSKTIILSNSLDPNKKYVYNEEVRNLFRQSLNLEKSQKLILTVCRISSDEAYKGYDKTIEALALINNSEYIYHIIGKYDEEEFLRIINLIESFGLQKNVKLVGYVSDEELSKYYQAADLFVMPSKGEGFGIVFIEAMANGLRVIAGNEDGSVDAVGAIADSKLVNPNNINELSNSIREMLSVEFSNDDKIKLSDRCKELFSPEKLENNIEKYIF